MDQPGQLPLRDVRVLVVEDDYFIADDLRASLIGYGAEVIGPVGWVSEAEAFLSVGGRIDAVILDINLHGAAAYHLADILRMREVPFVFATGYGADAIPAPYKNVPRWEKPYRYEILLTAWFSSTGRPHETS